jgi:hypothetical protein
MNAKLRKEAWTAVSCLVFIQCWNVQADVLSDTSATLGLRNLYLDRDYKQSGADKSRLGGWTQGFDLQVQSGYTPGTVGIGLDLSAQYALRLDGGGGRGSDTIIPYSASSARQATDYGHAAATLKARIGKTEFKAGELRPRLPVASVDDSRQLITTYQGWQIEFKEVPALTLVAGQFKTLIGRNSSNREKLSLSGSTSQQHSDGLSFAGWTYSFNPQLSTSYFYGQLDDIYTQHYLGLSLSQPLANEFTFKADLRYYDNRDEGQALDGKIDNQVYGGMLTLGKSGHGLGVGYQRMLGDTGFPLTNGYAAWPYLVNWSPTAFAKAGERSWQIKYEYDFAAAGIPGLRLSARYIKGSHIDHAGLREKGTEWEATTVLSYVIQQGVLKNLGFEWRHINQATGYAAPRVANPRYDENRFITTYVFHF